MMKDGQVYIETKGDAVDQADPMITADDIVGVVVFTIPFIGGAMALIEGHIKKWLILIAVIIGLFIVYGLIEKKKQKKDIKVKNRQ